MTPNCGGFSEIRVDAEIQLTIFFSVGLFKKEIQKEKEIK